MRKNILTFNLFLQKLFTRQNFYKTFTRLFLQNGGDAKKPLPLPFGTLDSVL